MLAIAILDDYQQIALDMAEWTSLAGRARVSALDRPLGPISEAALALADFDIVVLMRERQPFPRALFQALPRLRCLVTTGLRNSAIDLAAARDHGVTVCHTRSGATEYGTCELTWALILAATRHLPLEERRLREGRWQTTIGHTLHGKTLGLLGLGRLGTRVAGIGSAFGMQVIAWSPHLTDARAANGGAQRVAKDELFSRSDVLSLHLVLGPGTRGIVGADELARMPRHALLVNTSRAGLVDEAALLDALEARRLGGAALDVFEQEPLPRGHPFTRLDNVVLSPHLGYVTHESYRIFFHDVVENITAFLAGAPLRVLAADA